MVLRSASWEQRAGVVRCSVMPYIAVCCRVKVLQYHDGMCTLQSAQTLAVHSHVATEPGLPHLCIQDRKQLM